MSDVAAYHVFVCALCPVQRGVWTGYSQNIKIYIKTAPTYFGLIIRLLMSYIYGAPIKDRYANFKYIYRPTFGNAETVLFYLLHNVSTLNQTSLH